MVCIADLITVSRDRGTRPPSNSAACTQSLCAHEHWHIITMYRINTKHLLWQVHLRADHKVKTYLQSLFGGATFLGSGWSAKVRFF